MTCLRRVAAASAQSRAAPRPCAGRWPRRRRGSRRRRSGRRAAASAARPSRRPASGTRPATAADSTSPRALQDAAGERRAPLPPQQRQQLQRVLEQRVAVRARRERGSRRPRARPRTTPARARRPPAAAQHVERRDHLPQVRDVAVRDAGDQRAQPHPLVAAARNASVVKHSRKSSQARPTWGIWRKWSITYSASKPAVLGRGGASRGARQLPRHRAANAPMCRPKRSATGRSTWRAAAADAWRRTPPGRRASAGSRTRSKPSPARPSRCSARRAAARRGALAGSGRGRARLRSRHTAAACRSDREHGIPARAARSRQRGPAVGSSPSVSTTVVSPRPTRATTCVEQREGVVARRESSSASPTTLAAGRSTPPRRRRRPAAQCDLPAPDGPTGRQGRCGARSGNTIKRRRLAPAGRSGRRGGAAHAPGAHGGSMSSRRGRGQGGQTTPCTRADSEHPVGSERRMRVGLRAGDRRRPVPSWSWRRSINADRSPNPLAGT